MMVRHLILHRRRYRTQQRVPPTGEDKVECVPAFMGATSYVLNQVEGVDQVKELLGSI